MDASKGYQPAQYIALFGLYLPVTYILAGILADVVAQSYKESSASLAAIFGMLFNKSVSHLADRVMGYKTVQQQRGILNGMAVQLQMVSSGCTVPGLEGFESIVAPQSLVIIFAMIIYYWIDISKNGTGQSIGTLVGTGAILVIIQLGVLYTNACWTGDFYISNYYLQKFMIYPILMALLCGTVGAGIAYGVNPLISNAVNKHSNNATSNFVFVPGGKQRTSSQTVGSSDSALPHLGGSVGGEAGTSSSDDDQFVCDAYKNGELISSTITE